LVHTHLLHEVLEISFFLTPNQKHLPYPTKESSSEGEGPKYISYHGSTTSHFPFVVTPNWGGEKWVHSQ